MAKGLGWLLVLAIPYVLLGALFAPRMVQALNPVACRSGGHLTNRGTVGDGSGSTSSSIELACRSGAGTENVTLRIVLIIAALAGAALICFTVSSHLHLQHTRRFESIARR